MMNSKQTGIWDDQDENIKIYAAAEDDSDDEDDIMAEIDGEGLGEEDEVA